MGKRSTPLSIWLHAGLVPARWLPELAGAAEQAGFDGLALSDHAVWPREIRSPYPYGGLPPDGTEHPDVWVVIGALAAVTTRLRFVTKIYLAAARDPLVLGRALTTAAALSGGRVELGVGAGWMREEFEILGVDPATRGARLDETVAVLRALWAGGWTEHHGRFFDFPPLRIDPVPDGPLRVYGGGESEAALRRAAQLDGWLGAAYDPERLRELMAEVTALRVAAGLTQNVYEMIAGVRHVPDREDCLRLHELGLTGVTVAPWTGLPAAAGRNALHDAIARFGDEVIGRL